MPRDGQRAHAGGREKAAEARAGSNLCLAG